MALKMKKNYDKNIENILLDNQDLFRYHFKDGELKSPQLNFYNQDFLERDWSSASMVFSNSTCFDNQLIRSVWEKALTLQKGTIFVNTCQGMPKKYISNWQVITPFGRKMSWGVAKFFIYRKKY